MRAILLATAAVALSGCIIIDADVDSDFDRHRDLEQLYAVSVEADGVRVRVASNGCTSENSFDIDVDHRGDDRYAISIEREAPDRCRAMLRDGVEVFFSRDRLGLPRDAVITVRNPIGH